MSKRELDVALRLFLESRGLDQGLPRAGRNVTDFTTRAGRDMQRLNTLIGGVHGQLLRLGVGVGFLANQRLSGQLDQDLMRIRQTAGATADEMRGLRTEIFNMARDTGRPLESIKGGFNNLVQAGLDWKQSLAAIKAINPASAVTGASEDVLAGGLTVAARSYGFDLSRPRVATTLLDQMTVAGRLGNAELEDLSGIFARTGVNAKSAHLPFSSTLGFIETLSQIERQPERLATLADSTLRIFTNNRYKKAAQRATHVPFYDANGQSRDPIDVLDDIAARYKTLTTDKARDKFIYRGFGNADLDTQRGLRTLLGGDTLSQWRELNKGIEDAAGTISRDLPDAMDNAVVQGDRLKTTLRQAGDEFAKPFNKAFSNAIDPLITSKAKGGIGVDSGDLVALGIGGLVAGKVLGGLGGRLLGKLPGGLGKIFGSTASTAAGVAQGKALESIAGVTPVFVTNWGDANSAGAGAGGGIADAASGAAIARAGGSFFTRLLPLGAAALGGVEAGQAIYNKYGDTDPFIKAGDELGKAVDHLTAFLGSSDAKRRLGINQSSGGSVDSRATIRVMLDQNGRLKLSGMQSTSGLDLSVASGPMPGLGG